MGTSKDRERMAPISNRRQSLAHTFVDNLRKRYQGAQDKIRRTGSGSGDTREGEIVGDRLPMEHVHDHAWREFAFLKVQDGDLDAWRRSLRDKGVLLFGGSAVVSKATVKHAGGALQTSKPSRALSSAGLRRGDPAVCGDSGTAFTSPRTPCHPHSSHAYDAMPTTAQGNAPSWEHQHSSDDEDAIVLSAEHLGSEEHDSVEGHDYSTGRGNVFHVPVIDADIEAGADDESEDDGDTDVPRVGHEHESVFDNPIEPISDRKAASRVPRKGVPMPASRRIPSKSVAPAMRLEGALDFVRKAGKDSTPAGVLSTSRNDLRKSGAGSSSRNSRAGDDGSGGAAKFFADRAEDARAITKLKESKTKVVMDILKQAEERKAKSNRNADYLEVLKSELSNTLKYRTLRYQFGEMRLAMQLFPEEHDDEEKMLTERVAKKARTNNP
jgi:hypothetical protein